MRCVLRYELEAVRKLNLNKLGKITHAHVCRMSLHTTLAFFVMIIVNYIIKITLLIIHLNARTKYLFYIFCVCV